jgi:RNA polymerase primary sigma factor
LPHNQEYDIYKAKIAGEEVQNLTTIEIDAPIGEEGDATVGDVLLNDQPEVMLEFEKEEIKFRVKKMINVLDKERDRKVIKAYFGIDCDYEMPTEVIAQRFDLTNVRVCQIVKAALTKMKEAAV